jgi:hypothetical protein
MRNIHKTPNTPPENEKNVDFNWGVKISLIIDPVNTGIGKSAI